MIDQHHLFLCVITCSCVVADSLFHKFVAAKTLCSTIIVVMSVTEMDGFCRPMLSGLEVVLMRIIAYMNFSIS